MREIPRTRWETAGTAVSAYAERFDQLIADGQDIDGEARLADTLCPREAAVLDAGSGMGRVGAGIAARGHHVIAVEKDPDLVARSRGRYPGLPVVVSDILGLTPELLSEHGHPAAYDLIVAVGNVMVFLAEDTEVDALRTLASLLSPEGRMLIGFRTSGGPVQSGPYPVPRFLDDVHSAGLVVQSRFGAYDLSPAEEEYVVAVLQRD